MKTKLRFLRSVLQYAVILGTICSIFQMQLSAQPILNFKRVVNNWPTIELYFNVACDGTPKYEFNKDINFKLYENGYEIDQFTLWCPDPGQRCAISVALVFDASGSMTGVGNAGAKLAGHAFIDLMDGIIDEGAILWFADIVTVAQTMTSNTSSLHTAMNTLPANGRTACWDGIYAGLQEVINGGNNPCRAVVALSDGADNASIHTPQDIISLANRNRIRVFTVGLGGVQPTNLELVALLTGGRYYQVPSAEQLVSVYQEISTIIFAGFMECLITYQATCADGGLRTIDLSLINFCSGSDTKTKTFRADRDTTTFTPIEIGIAKRTGKGGTEVRLPLLLNTSINPAARFEIAAFSIQFDPNLAQFKSIKTPPGTLLNGVSFVINSPSDGTVDLKSSSRTLVQGNGTLAELVFTLLDQTDTVLCPVALKSWAFEAGCFTPSLIDGEIEIYPGSVNAIDPGAGALPDNFWLGQNAPNPFNPNTTIEYYLPYYTKAKITVLDILGNHVRTLVDEEQQAGMHRVVFSAAELPSGTYIYRLETRDFTGMKRMILAK